MFALALPASAESGKSFHVKAIIFDLAADTTIGIRKAGLLCSPVGRWRRNDIDDRQIDAAAADATRIVMLQGPASAEEVALSSDVAPASDFVIIGKVSTARLKLCRKNLVFNKSPRLNGKINLAVKWSLYAKGKNQVLAEFETDETEESGNGDFDGPSAAFRAALRKNAESLTPMLDRFR